jgi:hypothetical protein
MAGKIHPGDYLLCHPTGISRLVGILEVNQRFDVELIDKLDAKTAIPIISLKDKLRLFKGLKSKNAWTRFFRGSPAEFGSIDGETMLMQ